MVDDSCEGMNGKKKDILYIIHASKERRKFKIYIFIL